MGLKTLEYGETPFKAPQNEGKKLSVSTQQPDVRLVFAYLNPEDGYRHDINRAHLFFFFLERIFSSLFSFLSFGNH